MSNYIHFTEEQKARARQTDLAELLRGQGEQLKRSGKEYEWRDGGAKVTVRGNLWYPPIRTGRRRRHRLCQKVLSQVLPRSGGRSARRWFENAAAAAKQYPPPFRTVMLLFTDSLQG